ncbi:STAS domain-containing protein [Fuchsiella alkaliacetigena]|uniref:STAS domain-containing protein n=1 Tax=Fuchsiella alkaliacetigena TaxID=957042 RepID=UPI00200A1326|nr:STAS domain-containing protein [Fuchsiella alkaliacetigena]MCK8823894.1 STAS domain-containing protein [Fuchsiella alkaliacetigena]
MFELPESLNVHNVKETQEALLSYLQNLEEEQLLLDATLLQDIDAAGVQLLLSTYKTCQEERIEFNLANEQDIIKKLLKSAGVSDIITTKEKEVGSND